MTPTPKLFGVGARYGVVFILDETTGAPKNNGASSTMETGYQVEGIKTFSPDDPDPQIISHYGDDHVEAQDSLPATEAMKATITTDKTNYTLDAALAGTKVRDFTYSQYMPGNTNKKGAEKQVALFAYRQALDGNPSSSSFGKKRQWEGKYIPSSRIVAKENTFEQGATDKSYNVIPTVVKQTIWGEALNESDWGATEAQIFDSVYDYQPRWAYAYGNNTLTSFVLPAAPVSTLYCKVWVNGTVVVPSTINTTDGTMTLAAAPGTGSLVWVELQTTAV